MHDWQVNTWRTCAQPVAIRAMPENEIPPAMRVDYYLLFSFLYFPFPQPIFPPFSKNNFIFFCSEVVSGKSCKVTVSPGKTQSSTAMLSMSADCNSNHCLKYKIFEFASNNSFNKGDSNQDSQYQSTSDQSG